MDHDDGPSPTDPAAALAPGSSHANVADLLTGWARDRPDAAALVDRLGDEPRTLSWAELEGRVEAVAAASVAGSGLVAGQRLALCGPNSLAWVVGYLAALRAGLVVVPVDPDAPSAEQEALLDASGAQVVWGTGSFPGRAVVPLADDAVRDPDAAAVVSPADPESLAALAATAGTSGPPKLAMLSHRALLAGIRHSLAGGLVQPDDVAVAVLPFSHVFGFNAVLGGWLGSGARLVLAPADPETLLATVAAERVTSLPLTPSLLFRLRDRPGLTEALATVRRLFVAGAGLPWRLGADVEAATGHRVERAYGLTEAAPAVSTTLGTELLGPTHVGRPLPGVEVRVGTGLDPGEPGPVWIRGDNLFGGYWPDASGGPDAEGWFDTGDVGYQVGADLFVVDRARELVSVNGFTVYPSEVEQAVRELPGVTGVAALGTGTGPGTRIVVVVTGSATVDEVTAHCRSRLAPFKRPAEVRLIDELPRSVTGRVLRHSLRRLVTSAEGPG